MVKTFDEGGNPSASMNVLRAIRWGISAWEHDVSSTTIRNCWIRSQVYDWQGSTPEGNEWSDSEDLLAPITNDIIIMEQQGQIRDRMALTNFLNPPIEVIDDSDQEIVDSIIARFEPERLAEDDEEVEYIPHIKLTEALQALETLKLYEEQQEKGDEDFTKTLRYKERALKERKHTALKQSTIQGWIGGKTGGLAE